MPREDLVAALSMGPQPQQAMDGRWQRLMQELLAKEEQKQAAFDPYQFGAGGQEQELAQGVTDPNAKFQGGGASGSWAPEAEPPSTLGEWWEQSTAFRPMAEEAVSAATLPGDVYAGEVDPASDEAIERAAGLAGMVTLGAGAVPAKGAELGMGIRAYHGSPHDFDKFSMEKIGTGEGAQAYGHGLYFAENEAVSRQYRDLLGTRLSAVDDPVARAQFWASDLGSREAAITHLESVLRQAKNYPKNFDKNDLAKTSQAIDYLKTGGDLTPKSGHMYEVDIAADPEHFLDWDKPLSQQSETVREKLGSLPWSEEYLKSSLPGGQIAPKTPEGAAQLREAGIPGIRYLDQGSRNFKDTQALEQKIAEYEGFLSQATPENAPIFQSQLDDYRAELERAKNATSNYVVFDDALISILRKYGMAGMIGTPLGLEMAQRLMEQEQQGQAANAL